MKVRRTIYTETDNFVVRDVIFFEMQDGKRAEAMAMEKTDRGMLFMLLDSSDDDDSDRGVYEEDYAVRVEPVERILSRFPSELRERMIAFEDGTFLHLYGGIRPIFLLPVENG